MFWKYLKKYHPDFSTNKISKQVVFKALYPKKVHEDKQIRYLMSNLLKLGERFLLAQHIEKGGTEVSLQLLEEFNKRKLDRHYNQLKTKLNLSLTNSKASELDRFDHQIKLTDIEQIHFVRQNNRQYNDKIQFGSNYLNRFFVLKKLKYACEMLDRQTFLSGSYQLGLPENWITWLEANNFWEEKAIKMYTYVFLALKHSEIFSHFETLHKILNTDISEISSQDQEDLFLYAINYCARKIRKGENVYVEIALSLYLKGIEKQILLEAGYLSPWTFDNIVKLALRLEKYTWIENFIKKHKPLLPTEFQENSMAYNLAELHCYKKDFNKALAFLFKVEFSDLVHHLGSRIMLSKIYYELEEEEALLSLMSAFIMFLKRNKKISDSIRKTCLNFCDILFLLTRGKVEKAEKKIQNITLLADKKWLLEKIEVLKTKA